MRIAIDAPPVRSLSANEKMIYQLLNEGKTPREIAKKLHLALGSVNDLKYNTHDVMPDTVVNLITSIRQKGWDIPTSNKEEAEMPRITLTEEDKRSIVTANQAGASVTELAAKFNIAKGTVYNIVSEWKKRGEIAFQEAVNEDFERFKSDDDNVYEVTADTDIEAYMADRNKEEPATAATETGSEQEICNDIPADIIPENHEDVKPESKENIPIIPESVLEACRERRLNLQKDIEDFEASIDDWKRQIEEINDFIALAKMCNPVGGTV